MMESGLGDGFSWPGKERLDGHNRASVFDNERAILCPIHKGRKIELWCKNHNDVICISCAFLDHRLCTDVVDISECDLTLDVEEFHDVNRGVHKTNERLEINIKIANEAQAKLRTEKESCIQVINGLVKRLIGRITRLGNLATQQVLKEFQVLENKLGDFQSGCTSILEGTYQIMKQMETSHGNKRILSIMVKQLKRLTREAKLLENRTNDEIGMGKSFRFKMDTEVVQYFNSLSAIGSLQEIDLPVNRQTILNKSTTLPALYVVNNQQEFPIKLESDQLQCDVEGICFLHDGALLVADTSNKMIKCFDRIVYKFIASCKLSSNPNGVCALNETEAAVSLVGKAIQLISVKDRKIAETRRVDVEHECFGIANCKGEIVVADTSQNFYIYNTRWQLKRKLNRNSFGIELFDSSKCVCINESTGALFLTDNDSGVIGMNKDGLEQFQYKGANICDYHGICSDSQGSLLVAGWGSHNVMQVSEKHGDVIGEVVAPARGICYPQSVLFDKRRQRLIVARWFSNAITVFDLKTSKPRSDR